MWEGVAYGGPVDIRKRTHASNDYRRAIVRLFSALREYSVLAYLHVACYRSVAALFVQGSFTDFPIVRWFAVGLECLLFECTLRIDVIKTK